MVFDQNVLEELKGKLIAEKERMELELGRFTHKNEDGGYDSNFPQDLGDEKGENATEVEEYADRLGIEKSLETQLKDVTDALDRIDAGTYGIDEETGEELDINRLRAYPAARKNVR